jgi:uncharacterized membrane protein
MVKNWLKVGALLPLGLLLGACNTLLETPSPLEISLNFPQEVAPGNTASGTLTVKSAGYTGQVSLKLVSPTTGFTLVEPATININSGNNDYLVKVQVGSNVQPQTYEVVVEVTPQGGAPIQVKGTLKVTASSSNPPSGGGGTPGLTAQVNPTSLNAYQGRTSSFTLTLTPSGGLTGLALLSLENGGTPVSWATLSPNYVNITSASQQSVPLTLNVASEAPEGTYNLTLKIVHNAGEAKVPLSLTVKAPSFNISLSKTAFTVIPDGSVGLRLTITNEGGFSGTVSLSLLGGSDAGKFTLTPSEVDIAPDDTSIVVPLTIKADSSVTPGEYLFYLNATSGTITRKILVDITVPEPPYFNIEVAPTSLEIPSGETGTITLNVTPLYGFTGTLNLSLDDMGSSGITLLGPTSVSVRGGVSQSYTLVLKAPQVQTTTSPYPLRLEASSGNITSYSNTFEVKVTTPTTP